MKTINFAISAENSNEVIITQAKSFELTHIENGPVWPKMPEKEMDLLFDKDILSTMDSKWAHAKELLNGSLIDSKNNQILLRDGVVFDADQYNRINKEFGTPCLNRSTLSLIDGLENYEKLQRHDANESTLVFRAVRNILKEREKLQIDLDQLTQVQAAGKEKAFIASLIELKGDVQKAFKHLSECTK